MGSFGKCRTIRHIVRLRQMLRRWRARACGGSGGGGRRIPSDVPAGHLAVCVGSSSRRFVVRAAYLNHPVFRKLLVQTEEEYGFEHQGPLAIPCDESLFEEILRYISSSGSAAARFATLEDFQFQVGAGQGSGPCNAGVRGAWHDSFPLLRGFQEKSSVW